MTYREPRVGELFLHPPREVSLISVVCARHLEYINDLGEKKECHDGVKFVRTFDLLCAEWRFTWMRADLPWPNEWLEAYWPPPPRGSLNLVPDLPGEGNLTIVQDDSGGLSVYEKGELSLAVYEKTWTCSG